MLVDDDATFRRVLAAEFEAQGFEILSAESGTEAIRIGRTAAAAHVVLLDLQLPDINGLEVLRAIRDKSPGSEVIMLTGSRFDRYGDRGDSHRRRGLRGQALPARRTRGSHSASTRAELPAATSRPAGARSHDHPDPGRFFLGDSPAFRKTTLDLIERVAPSDSSVLVSGETGSGKEMAAKMLHARSPRRDRPFVVVECAALQEDLLQSELFGHEKGAFTGAERAKPGLFEVADPGPRSFSTRSGR